MHNIYSVSGILFYVVGAITLLAHLVNFVKNWLKIAEMRQKRRDSKTKSKSEMEKLRIRLQTHKHKQYQKLIRK